MDLGAEGAEEDEGDDGLQFSHLLMVRADLCLLQKMNSATLFFQIELTIEIFRQDMN